jgi:hypothetical protein
VPLALGKEENVMSSSQTKTSLKQRVLDLIAGTQKHPPTGSLTLGNATYTAQALVQTLQGLASAIDAADAAKASWKDALGKVDTTRATVIPLMQDCAAWVAATYRTAPSTLADFGVVPRKARTPLSTEAQTAAIAKREATRAARHTMGKVQKKAVKGNVTASPSGPSGGTSSLSATSATTARPASA